MKRKVFSFVLAVCMVIGVAMSVLADSGATYYSEVSKSLDSEFSLFNNTETQLFIENSNESLILPVKTDMYYGNGDFSNFFEDEFANNRVIVRVSGNVVQTFSTNSFFGIPVESVDDLMTIKPKYEANVLSYSPTDSIKVLTLKTNSHEAVKSAINILNKTPGIVYAEPDFMVKSFDIIPNDPHFNTPSMWGMNKIHAPSAWEISTGSHDVVVAVIDTGVDYNHPDLNANMWKNPGEIPDDGIDNDGNGFIDDVYGWSFLWGDESNNNVGDLNGHGTHIAGIIGSVGDNNVGISGVCWNVKLMPVRALTNFGGGFTSDIIKAIDYARLMNAQIINCSFGGFEYSQAQKDAIDNTNALFVVAAGNSTVDNDITPSYPANYDSPNIITVAATTYDDSLALFSNYGANNVHIAAPGDNIFSTTPVGTYGILSGTSMAAPFVSGAAALVLAENPNMTVQELKERLISSVDLVPELTDKVLSGGRLNVLKALNPNAPGKPQYIPQFPPPPDDFTGFSGGRGTLEDPYKISTPNQLNAVRDYPDKHFIQINDIDMTFDTQNPDGLYFNETQGWKPIEYLSGVYDGGGYKIIGLKIARAYGNVFGLFAVNQGWIMNLGLEDSDIIGTQGGSIAGGNVGIIYNCNNTGRVIGFTYTGGLTRGGGEIINCYNSGEVSAVEDYVAIAGGLSAIASKITNSYNTGSVSTPYASDHRPGGIMSYGSESDFLKNCYTTSIVTTPNGFGYGSIFYSNPNVTVEHNSFSLGSFGSSSLFENVLTIEQMKTRESFIGWDFDNIWDISQTVNDGYPHLRPFAPMLELDCFEGGDGSFINPYQVSTPEQLNMVREHLNKNFIQVNDIDLTYDTQNPSGIFYNEEKGWLPIGAIENPDLFSTPFNGTYDGGGYKIIGLKSNRVDYSYVGLFAVNLSSSTIKNTALIDVNIHGGKHTGGFIGENQGVVERCYISGSVSSNEESSLVGGITGKNIGKIIDCYNIANIYGITYAGGISGEGNNLSEIINCYNAGDILGNGDYIGGIVGFSNGFVKYSYSLDLYNTKYGGNKLTSEQMKLQS